MGWVDRSEESETCPGYLGPVADQESVARLVVRLEPDTGYNPFSRTDLLPPKKTGISDACGEQDGFSVDRCSSLSESELLDRSAARANAANKRREAANKAPNQFANGAFVAQVDDLRKLMRPNCTRQRAIFIYDDGFQLNREHAVLRMVDTIPEEEVSIVLADLKDAFYKRVKPVADKA